MHFIFPFVKQVDFDSDKITSFADCPLAAGFDNDICLHGVADFIVATGMHEPDKPFFLFHEYKREKGGADDPIAQLLCSMLVGQRLNDNGKPVYGAYVIGRNWFFATLHEREYCLSNAFVCTLEDHLPRIYTALQAMKIIIERDLLVAV